MGPDNYPDSFFTHSAANSTIGFVVMDYYHRRSEAVEVLSSAIKEGKLTIAGGETIVRCPDFEKIPDVWMRLFRGENTGKLVTQVADFYSW